MRLRSSEGFDEAEVIAGDTDPVDRDLEVCRDLLRKGSKSIAAAAMSVTHHDTAVPTTSMPSSTWSVLVPTNSRIRYTRRVPSPDRLKADVSISTPRKKVRIGSPKPALTTVR